MKSSNPYSGINEVEISCTLDTLNPSPSKNQGGMCILDDAVWCIKGNIAAGRDSKSNGFGIKPNISYTLSATDVPAVTDYVIIYECASKTGSLMANEYDKIGHQGVATHKYVVENRVLLSVADRDNNQYDKEE